MNISKWQDQEKIMKELERLTNETRNELSKKHDIEKDYPHYEGLCYEASGMLTRKLLKQLKVDGLVEGPDKDFSIVGLHGEQKHNPKIKSSKWPIQHDWVKIEILGKIFYIDPTSEQFQDIYDDIPDYYISNNPPKWFYQDDDNPRWRSLHKLNEVIMIPRKVDWDGEPFTVHDGIIEIFQYEIWGKISDFIRWLFRIK